MSRGLPLALLLCAATPAFTSLLFLSATGCSEREHEQARTQYHCPMHPTYVSDRPGDCPICGMAIVPIGAPPAPPSVPTPSSSAAPAAAPPARAEVTVNEEGRRLAGVTVAVATEQQLTHKLRTVGAVVPDERRVQHVHTKISGWVEKLFVSYTGQFVQRGAPILSLYSPELLASQEEYLQARQAVQNFDGALSAEIKRGSEQIEAASRRRLLLQDIPKRAIAELERTGIPTRAITLTAPVVGFVTTKQVFPGQQVDPGMELFTITDLRRVWIEAEVFESEAPLVRVGQSARLRFPSDPARRLEAKVSYIAPSLAPDTRTLKVRFDFDNQDLSLKPGMFVDVDLELEAEQGVVIPDSAIIDTGLRKIVYVETAQGQYAPREVEIGPRAAGLAIVVSGVRAGERVVVQGNFLIDSESRIRAAINASSPTPTPAPVSAPK